MFSRAVGDIDSSRVDLVSVDDKKKIISKIELEDKAGFFERIKNWVYANSISSLFIGSGCCGVENLAVEIDKYGHQLGFDGSRCSYKDTDLLIVAGVVSKKQMIILKYIYSQMAKPKWVMAIGVCACSGGGWSSSNVVQGINLSIPVDIYIPGCPPDPAAIAEGFNQLKYKIETGVSNVSR